MQTIHKFMIDHASFGFAGFAVAAATLLCFGVKDMPQLMGELIIAAFCGVICVAGHWQASRGRA